MTQSKAERRTSRMRYKLRTAAANNGRKRLSVFRSNSHIYAQIIDDIAGKTLAVASTVDKDVRKSLKTGASIEAAAQVGSALAKRAKSAGVKDVYFDRGGFRYQGRVKALADAARSGGLNF